MSDEMYYFYHVAHMAKHFENGGCGVRPFLDLWILNHRMEFDGEKRDALLQKGGLLKFAKSSERMSEVWFSGAESDDLSDRFAAYIFHSGAYGTIEQRVQMGRAKRGGKFKYLLCRIFVPYSYLKKLYPILEKHKWLMPFYQIRRWFSVLFRGRVKHVTKELMFNASVDGDKVNSAGTLLSDLGL